MAKTTHPLSDAQVEEVTAKDKPFKLFDGKGLYLLIVPARKSDANKYWRLKYRSYGKEKLMALGVYPEVSLTEARIRRDDALLLVTEGHDPSEARKKEKAKEKAVATTDCNLPSLRLMVDGGVEIRKGRASIHLTKEEAFFVIDLLNKTR